MGYHRLLREWHDLAIVAHDSKSDKCLCDASKTTLGDSLPLLALGQGASQAGLASPISTLVFSYNQRCAERLKASRELLVARFRQTDKDLSSTFEGPLSSSREEEVAETVQDVMTQEWERLRWAGNSDC